MEKNEKRREVTRNDGKGKNRASFEARRFSIGIFSTATVLAVIGVFVVINLLAGNLNVSFDLTRDGNFSISDQTRELLRELDEPVTIYTLFRQGEAVLRVEEMLNQYAAASGHIRVVNRDPYIHLGFLAPFTEAVGSIEPGSIIVESDRRFRVIHAHELMRMSLDPLTFEPYVEFDLEPRVTNAVVFVTTDAQLVAYELAGHGQRPFPPGMVTFLEDAGYELRQYVSLFGPVPQDADILIITTPERDFHSREEAGHIRDFIMGGGAVLFLIGHTPVQFPLLMEIIEEFGVTVETGFRVHDANTEFHVGNVNFSLMPHMRTNDVSLRIHGDPNRRLFMPNSVPVTQLIVPANVTTILPLIETSDQAFVKTSGGTSFAFEPGDTRGQFNLAVGITHEFTRDIVQEGVVFQGMRFTSRLAVIGNDHIVADSGLGYLNWQYIVAAMNWLIERPERDIFIPARAFLDVPRVIADARQSTIMKVFVWFVFPSAIMGTGVGVWLKRRNK